MQVRKKKPELVNQEYLNHVHDEIDEGQKLMTFVLLFNVAFTVAYAIFTILFVNELYDLLLNLLPVYAAELSLPDIQVVLDALTEPESRSQITISNVYSMLAQVLFLVMMYMGHSWARFCTGISSFFSGLGGLVLATFFAIAMENYLLAFFMVALSFLFFYTGALLLFSYSIKVYSMFMRA